MIQLLKNNRNMSDSITKEEQLRTVYKGYHHVVILGAGASIACTLDRPEKKNMTLPSMDNLLKVLGLEDEVSDITNAIQSNNFESVFSFLYEEDPDSELLKYLEKSVYDYFDTLELPEEPTIYDYLILSLRKKDVVATFNWDPFLWQAFIRNSQITDDLPNLLFLHGNVAIGICEESKTFGPKGKISRKSGKRFEPIKLLYPITKKNYNDDPFIMDQWNYLSASLKNPARVTIFGYSAPKSDVEAIGLMKSAYGNPEDHKFTQFEIIDIKPREFLEESWKGFTFSHHFEIHDNFWDSTIMKFPRRTGEVFFENYLQAKWYQTNTPPKFDEFDDLWKWYSRFFEYEKEDKK